MMMMIVIKMIIFEISTRKVCGALTEGFIRALDAYLHRDQMDSGFQRGCAVTSQAPKAVSEHWHSHGLV